VLPDYQGVGIGQRLLEFVGRIYLKQGYRYTITTSQPSLMTYFKNNLSWFLITQGRMKWSQSKTANKQMKKSGSERRIITSWEYRK